MADVRSRLTACFSAVFPKLDPAEIPRASTTSIADWNSLKTATLLAVLEEEFAIQVAPEDLARFISFAEVLSYLQGRDDVVCPSGSRDCSSDS
jgi:acyl carrier protein